MNVDPYIPPNSNLGVPAEQLSNPHSLPKQLTGVIVCSLVVVIAVASITGLISALVGIFTFLDAWNSGIYKDPDKKSLTNISPMGWGISMMLIWFIAYPIYLFKRKKLKTKDGPKVYWVFVHIFSAPFLVLTGLQIFAAFTGSTS
jgi:hypothetical protein